MHGKDYVGDLACFGEGVLARLSEDVVAGRRTSKRENRWRLAMWLGRTEEANDDLLWDGQKLIRARSIRRFARGDARRCNLQLVRSLSCDSLGSSWSRQ